MRTIVRRVRKSGSTGYTALIAIQRKGEKTHRESSTFNRKREAEIWMKGHEAVLYANPRLASASAHKATVGDAIKRYVCEQRKTVGRTKTQILKTLLEYDIADLQCDAISSVDIVNLARQLSEGRDPSIE